VTKARWGSSPSRQLGKTPSGRPGGYCQSLPFKEPWKRAARPRFLVYLTAVLTVASSSGGVHRRSSSSLHRHVATRAARENLKPNREFGAPDRHGMEVACRILEAGFLTSGRSHLSDRAFPVTTGATIVALHQEWSAWMSPAWQPLWICKVPPPPSWGGDADPKGSRDPTRGPACLMPTAGSPASGQLPVQPERRRRPHSPPGHRKGGTRAPWSDAHPIHGSQPTRAVNVGGQGA